MTEDSLPEQPRPGGEDAGAAEPAAEGLQVCCMSAIVLLRTLESHCPGVKEPAVVCTCNLSTQEAKAGEVYE